MIGMGSIGRLLVMFVLVFLSCKETQSADGLLLRFHQSPQTASKVVLLQDLVEFVSGSSLPSNSASIEQLKGLPLGPAPREGQSQSWTKQEVLQLLELRGIDPGSIRWLGDPTTKLQGVSNLPPSVQSTLTPAFTDHRTVDSASRNVSAAIKDYLNYRTNTAIDWRVEATIPVQYSRQLQSRKNVLSVAGGSEPWTGRQEFVLIVKNGASQLSIPISADVQNPPLVVVASGPLRRDQLLTEDRLAYAPLSKNSDPQQYFTDIQSLVGKQLRKSVSTNQPIGQELVGQPIVIHRNDLIEVESVAGAVVVKSSAKSLSAGAVGDLIDIEMPNRKKIRATVVESGLARIVAVSHWASGQSPPTVK
jgi:flagella basal body P-ring formation protein FlgA